ncbi:MAG: 3-phosphoshikimate 1-carboxyvinyltransferase [Oscillospiraceae bacterium]
MDVTISQGTLTGRVVIPPSKSVAHRLIIAAALTNGTSVIKNVAYSKDIRATINAMRALGADIEENADSVAVKGIALSPDTCAIDCGESGSALRFLVPICAQFGVNTAFYGHGKLPERPITPYVDAMTVKGINFTQIPDGMFSISGKLTAGDYKIAPAVSSQFVTGLLFALPMLDGDSRILIDGRLESKPYVDITIDCLKQFGIAVQETEYGYFVAGNQQYVPCDCTVEGDYSQAAFFCVANALGSAVEILGLQKKSAQGDMKILEICEEIVYNKNEGKNRLRAFTCDCSDTPDLVPILAVLASFCEGISEITNVARLRIKECDRLEAMTTCLNAVGGNVTAYPDRLVIVGVPALTGGTVDAFNDHRIPMAMAIAATRSLSPITITGAQCVDKSYPNFFDDLKALGANILFPNP